MNNMLKPKGRYAVLVLLMFLVFLCRNSLGSIDADASENVKIKGDLISIQVEGIRLGKLLNVIEEKTGIEFDLDKSLMDNEISVDFKELSVLEGIKKAICPLNYAIVYDPNDVVIKVIIRDQSNASSPMVVFNERSNGFPPGSYTGPPIEGAFIEGESNTHRPPGFELNQVEGPPGTNVRVEAPPSPEIAMIKGPKARK